MSTPNSICPLFGVDQTDALAPDDCPDPELRDAAHDRSVCGISSFHILSRFHLKTVIETARNMPEIPPTTTPALSASSATRECKFIPFAQHDGRQEVAPIWFTA